MTTRTEHIARLTEMSVRSDVAACLCEGWSVITTCPKHPNLDDRECEDCRYYSAYDWYMTACSEGAPGAFPVTVWRP